MWPAFMLACTSADAPEPSAAQHVREQCVSPFSEDFYFAPEAINPQNELIDSRRRYAYSRFLKSLEAPSLSCGQGITEAYRFLWMPSYAPAVVVLVRGIHREWYLEAAEFKHPRTHQQWTVANRVERGLMDNQVRSLLVGLARAQFWTVPTWKDSPAMDGAMWVIEGRVRDGYRVVSRPNPEDAFFKEAGRAFFTLAGIPVPATAR
jgi:hypothetical protein